MQQTVTQRPVQRPGVRHLPGLVACALAMAASHAGAGQYGATQPLVEWQAATYQQGAGISLDRAVAMAQQQYKARVVRASTEESGGRRVYVLRLLSDEGRVWTVRVDAQTGAMN